MYGLSIESMNAYIVMKASDSARIEQILSDNNIKTLSCEDLKNL